MVDRCKGAGSYLQCFATRRWQCGIISFRFWQKSADLWLSFVAIFISAATESIFLRIASVCKMSSEVAKISKPQLRGLLQSQIKKNLIIGFVLSVVGGVAFQVAVCDARKQRYADFYKTYDAEKEYQRMKAAGLFQSG